MSSYPDVYIVGAARTTNGKFLGGLGKLKASDLGAVPNKEEMSRAQVARKDVHEELMGHVVQAGPAQPYLVAGGGWYYTRIDFSGTLSAFDDDTAHVVGYHIGVGVDVVLTPQITLSADVRQIFIDPDFDNAEDEEFDFVQVGLGVSFSW